MKRPAATIIPIGSVSKWRAEPKSKEVYLTGRLFDRLQAADVSIEAKDEEARLYRLILR